MANIAFLQDGETFAPGSGTTITISFDSGSTGTDRYLAVIVFGAATDTLTGVTYAGVAMTQLFKQQGAAQGGRFVYIYGLANPTTGTNNIVSSFSSSITDPPTWYGVYTGVKATTQPDVTDYTTRGNGSGSFVGTAVTVANGCWFLAAEMDNNGNMAATANCVKRTGWSALFGVHVFDSNASLGAAGSHDLTVTGSNGGAQDLIMVGLKPAPDTLFPPAVKARQAVNRASTY